MLSLMLGQDASWDTKNYHIYNPWAILNNRDAHDIAPAHIPTYYNPLPDLPYFFFATGPLAHWPKVLAAVQGLWFGLFCYVVLRIGFRLAEYQGRQPQLADFMAVAIGVSGSMAVSQVGTTSNELTLAVFVLLGLYTIMPLFQKEPQHHVARVWLAGMSCGFAAGLKPTAMVYAPALFVTLLFTPATAGVRLRRAVLFTTGFVIAFLVSYGWWGVRLYQLTGNPFFPLFNNLFPSNLVPPISNRDPKYLPHDLMQWCFYPFFWLGDKADIVIEAPFADSRYALAMTALVAMGACWLVRRRNAWGDGIKQARVVHLIIVFVILSYVVWLLLFSILRYAISIEALTGIVMLIAVQAVVPWGREKPCNLTKVGLFMTLLLILLTQTTHYPFPQHVRYGKQVFSIDTGPVEPGSLVLLEGNPYAYLIPFFPQPQHVDVIGLNPLVQISQGHGLWSMIQQRIARQKGPIYILLRYKDDKDVVLLRRLLPDHRAGDCHMVDSNLEATANKPPFLRLCRLVHE